MTRTWICPPNRYEIVLHGAAVSCDCFGLDGLPGAGSVGADSQGRAEAAEATNSAMVAVGPSGNPLPGKPSVNKRRTGTLLGFVTVAKVRAPCGFCFPRRGVV
jgi:hypothetical protein